MDLGDLLIEEGLVSFGQVEAARDAALRARVPLVVYLIDTLGLPEGRLCEALLRAGHPSPNAAVGTEREQLQHLVPARTLERHEVVPLALNEECLELLCADPTDVEALAEVGRVSGRCVTPFVARLSEIRERRLALVEAVPDLPHVPTERVVSQQMRPAVADGTVPTARSIEVATVDDKFEALLLALERRGIVEVREYQRALFEIVNRKIPVR